MVSSMVVMVTVAMWMLVRMVVMVVMLLLSRRLLFFQKLHNFLVRNNLIGWVTTVRSMAMCLDSLFVLLARSAMRSVMVLNTLEKFVMTAVGPVPVQDFLERTINLVTYLNFCTELKQRQGIGQYLQ